MNENESNPGTVITEPVTNTQQAVNTSKTEQTTQPQAVNVDMEAINRAAEQRAERAAQTVVKDMLTKQGLDDNTIQEVLKDWKAKQTTPEDELIRERADHAKTLAENTKLKQEKILKNHGINDDEEINVYSIRINQLVTDGKDFETTAKEYFENHPVQQTPPPFYTGEGKTVVNSGVTLEDYRKKNYEEKLQFKKEHPELFKKFDEMIRNKK